MFKESDDELVIFSGESDRATEDCKCLKLTKMYHRIELLEA
jgi:hypothetical protein